MPQPYVRPASDPARAELRQAASDLVAELARHLESVEDLPAGPTSHLLLAAVDEPVSRAVARWNDAVHACTGAWPVALGGGWVDDPDDD